MNFKVSSIKRKKKVRDSNRGTIKNRKVSLELVIIYIKTQNYIYSIMF